ncbi:MAG: hypothetical protein M1291_02450 [Thaumarchaeota archaeon]|jgi:hypothetical protein|nr:hypothetical protein [Nitrososphaerota archaeon]MDG6931597.1 hypothetical protein [Nitrososphaerota archaeon]
MAVKYMFLYNNNGMSETQQESEQNFACSASAPVLTGSRISDVSHVEMGEHKPMGLKKTQNARRGNDLYASWRVTFMESKLVPLKRDAARFSAT